MNNPTNPAVPEPLAPSGGRNRQRWFLLVVAAMVAVAGGILLRGHLARRRAAEGEARIEARLLEEQAAIEARLHEAMAEAERLDGPWRFADIQARLAKIPEDEDSATILRAVAQKIRGCVRAPSACISRGADATPLADSSMLTPAKSR